MEFYTHQQHQQQQQEQKQAQTQQEIITEQERQQHLVQLQLQQKQQLQQQHLIVVDSMATGGGPVSTNSTSTTFNSSNINNNNNSNHNGNIISTTSNSNNNINNLNSNSNNLPTSSSSSSNNNNNNNNSSGSISTADAATVAIAKDMLQLHHGGGAMNHNNKSNNSASNGNGGSGVTTAAGSNGASNASSTTAGGMEHVSASSTQQNIPPAHANSSASSSSTSSASSGATSNSNSSNANTSPPDNALGYLKYGQDLLYITEVCTIIGRNSSTSHVHFHVAENNLVSRKHFQVLYKPDTRDFYVQCLSKNGIFVDDFLQRRNADPLKLPASCFFRFPSTEIRIQFESFVQPLNSGDGGGHNLTGSGLLTSSSTSGIHNNNHHHHQQHHALSAGNAVGNAHVIISPAPPDELPTQNAHHHHHQQQQQQHHHHQQHASAGGSAAHLMSMDNAQVIYSPLKISIPKKEEKSPYLSPTGTISAANSCPASPRQGFHQNQANYNNYGNNNLQNKQDLFQTPSTSSYNNNEKPPYSYAQLIVQAISAAPDKQLTLSGIYSFIVKHYPYYRKETNKGWQNSIRHNLSLNRYFIKVARSQDEPGKGSFWRIDPDSGAKLIDHSYKKRRQRSSQSFRPSYGMPRSAPVSPSHMDNSRESSPLHDIVLQSAPGSPGMSMENRANDADLVYSAQHQNSSANNSHNQYNSGSPYYVTNQNAQQQQQQHENNSSSGNGVGALIAVKRNHILAAGVGLQAQQQQQSLHPDIIYEEVPADYSGNVESGDECDSTAATAAASKRAKYLSEVL